MYSPTLNGESVKAKREEIKRYFNNTYELFEKVFEVLKDDTVFYEKSEITRHPMIFYFGHTATFFINKLIYMKIIKDRMNADFESIFAIGVDEMSWDDMENSSYAWPKVDEVREYRAKVKAIVNNLIDTLPLTLPITQESSMWIILMGIEHERIHIETSLVLHRQMPINFVKDSDYFTPCNLGGLAPKNEMITLKGKNITLGVNKSEHKLYGWDNEYGTFSEEVSDFKTSKYLVSNAEFQEFVDAGGYDNREFWDEEGEKFLELTGAKHPPFWVKDGDDFKYRTLTQEIPMPQDWPVDVNALEAEAFCRYKGQKDGVTYQLPSEAEYRVMYEYANIEDIPNFHESRANLDFYHYASSCPVNEFAFK